MHLNFKFKLIMCITLGKLKLKKKIKILSSEDFWTKRIFDLVVNLHSFLCMSVFGLYRHNQNRSFGRKLLRHQSIIMLRKKAVKSTSRKFSGLKKACSLSFFTLVSDKLTLRLETFGNFGRLKMKPFSLTLLIVKP